jgi:hypothetical protein
MKPLGRLVDVGDLSLSVGNDDPFGQLSKDRGMKI